MVWINMSSFIVKYMWQRMNLFHRSSSSLVYLWSSQAWHCQPQHFSNSQGVVFLSAPPFLLPLLSKLILSLFFLHVLQGREERWREERKWEKQKRGENERRQGEKGRLREEERKSEEKRRWVEERQGTKRKQKRGRNDGKHGEKRRLREEKKRGEETRW